MIDLVREIAQTISHAKLRTALTGLAVAWGIFMLITLVGVSRGLTDQFNSGFMSSIANDLGVWGGYTTKPYKGLPRMRSIQLRERDMEPVLQADTEHLAEATSEMRNDTVTFSYAGRSIRGGFFATYPQTLAENVAVKLVAGRMLNNADMQQRRRVVVLTDDRLKRLFGSSDPEAAIGKTVSAMGLSWTVVGVIQHQWMSAAFVPFTTGQRLSRGMDDAVNNIAFTLQNMETLQDGQQAEQAVRETFAKSKQFDVGDPSAIWISNGFTSFMDAMAVANILTVSMWAIGILTLLSGIIGVSNIMFVSVRERTHEIGIRRAIGARRRQLLVQVVLESVAITTIFGYIGIFLGIVMCKVLGAVFESSGFSEIGTPTVDLDMAIQVTVVLIVAGALAGLFPAIKATKISPVEALRDE